MSILSVETKKIPELQAAKNLVASDMVLVELASGGSRKMTYGDLIAVIQASLKGDEDAMMTVSNISSVHTNAENKVPSSALVKKLYDDFEVMKREIMAPYGYFGIEQNLDTLMQYVWEGQWDKFAIGDYFIDTRTTGEKVMWEIADKNGYLHCGDTPLNRNNIICIPRDCITDTKKYNSSNTNTGGYAASLMPEALEAVANTFSTKLQSYMTTVDRLENNKGSYAWAQRRISLPSVTEIFGNQCHSDYFSAGPVCHSLALFTGGNAHVMKGRGFKKSESDRQWYWLSDPSGHNTTHFCLASHGGNSNESYASSLGGLAPLIVLTNTKEVIG